MTPIQLWKETSQSLQTDSDIKMRAPQSAPPQSEFLSDHNKTFTIRFNNPPINQQPIITTTMVPGSSLINATANQSNPKPC